MLDPFFNTRYPTYPGITDSQISQLINRLKHDRSIKKYAGIRVDAYDRHLEFLRAVRDQGFYAAVAMFNSSNSSNNNPGENTMSDHHSQSRNFNGTQRVIAEGEVGKTLTGAVVKIQVVEVAVNGLGMTGRLLRVVSTCPAMGATQIEMGVPPNDLTELFSTLQAAMKEFPAAAKQASEPSVKQL